jgi:PhnB protein
MIMSVRESPEALVESLAAALRKKDVAALSNCYAEDVVAFDLVVPLQRRGLAAVRKRAEEWFASFEGPIGYEIREPTIRAAGDLAFYSGLHHVDATRKDGGKVDMWIRVTAGLEKKDGAWRIVHEHVSTPFDMTTMKAALDARP